MTEISFEDWQKLELKVGKILEVERIVNTDKLYKLKVDVGTKRPIQLVSSLVLYYTEEELKGRTIIVLTNLKRARFGGEVSEGMLLAAGSHETDACVLITVLKDVKPGTPVT